MPSPLERYLKKAADDLPTIPMVASQVMRAVDDPASSVDDIRRLIEQDAAIAARILKVSNSSLYGFPSEIQSLGHAISLLGTRTVRNLVLGASLKGTYKRFGLMEKLLWEHSATAGPAAAALARRPGVGVDAEEAFTVGLLHDLGKTALANSHRDEYEQVVARVYNEQRSFVEVEREQFGFDHAEVGAWIVRRWKLPDRTALVIRHHHELGSLPRLDEDVARLTALVAVTTAALTRLGVGRREPAEGLDLAAHPGWVYLGLPQEDVEPILELCTEQAKVCREVMD